MSLPLFLNMMETNGGVGSKGGGNSEGLGNAFYLHSVQKSVVTKVRQEHVGAFTNEWFLEMARVVDQEMKRRQQGKPNQSV